MNLKIEYVDINSIKPYKNNAKQHPREQIEQIKKSIEEVETYLNNYKLNANGVTDIDYKSIDFGNDDGGSTCISNELNYLMQ